VPIIAVGSAIAITGSALQSVGEGALNVGSDLSRAGQRPLRIEPALAPMAAPTLD
jgi:hypothetical protein